MYGPNEGGAARDPYEHTAKSPETPKGEGLSAKGELAHQSGVNTKGGARKSRRLRRRPSFRLTRESMEADRRHVVILH